MLLLHFYNQYVTYFIICNKHPYRIRFFLDLQVSSICILLNISHCILLVKSRIDIGLFDSDNSDLCNKQNDKGL